MDPMDHRLATWMAKIAAALEELGDCSLSYGGFYVSEVVIAYDGEDTSYRVVPDDHGGFALTEVS